MFIPVKMGLRQLAWPTATIALITTNVLVFAGQHFLSASFQYQLMLRPDHIDPVAWLTSMFMHADVLHLAVNMLFLWPFGMYLESRLGWARTLILYFASGIGASLAFFVMHYGERTASLGASGAVAGMMGLCVVAAPLGKLYVFPVHPVVLLMAYANNRKFMVCVPLFFWVALWVLAQVMYAWLGVDGIAFAAHFGGIVTGIALGLAMRTKVLPVEFKGPATEEEEFAEKRERLLHTVLAAWQAKPMTKPAVDYMRARSPKFHEPKVDAPPASIRELD
jgi:membrane associated rhomboid family serine protease